MKTCINCGNEVDTPYCSNCGQKQQVKRISFRGMFEEFLSKWIGFDNQFGRTIVGMIKAPERVVLSYLNGNRVRFIGPLGFAVIMTALVVISFDLFGLSVEDFLKQNQSQIQEMYDMQKTPEQEAMNELFLKPFNGYMAKNYRFLTVALIPFWAFSLRFFYKKRKMNYVERLVISTYLSCEAMWLTILSLVVLALTGYLASAPILILSFIYYTYGIHRILPEREIFESLVKAFFSVVVGFIFFFLFFSVIALGYLIWVISQNPQLFQQQG